MPIETAEFWTHMGHNLLVSFVFLVFAAVAFVGLWKLIDMITPGDLNKELLGQNENKSPNVALGIVVGAFIVAFGVIVAAAIH